MTITPSFIDLFDLKETSPPNFFRSYHEIIESSDRNPYSHFIRRAWESMSLSGIFCIDRKPTIYFKVVEQIDFEQIRILHRQLWNQGIATLLVVVSPENVYVYSGLAYPAKDQEKIDEGNRLVEILNITADALELRQFIQRVETGQIYWDKKECFKPDRIVDRYLLENLGKARDLLYDCGDLEYSTIHRLLGRIIFTCYLHDREIINGDMFSEAGATNVNTLRDLLNNYNSEHAKEILYNLFELLQEYFNGSMFDDATIEERSRISIDHIKIIRKFLNGEELSTGQLTFGFWVYDFKVIPIEAISAIYEDFLAAESVEGQKNIGAYYTPKHLAEMVVDIATDNWNSLMDKKILDPACGSGIFLVIIFNRIAEEWRHRNPNVKNIKRARALIEILQNQLCGIDVKETACKIACFSLYLALLDQLKPRDIPMLKERYGYVLPKLHVLKKENYFTTKSSVIFEGNFFDPNLPIYSSFDLVIGNPPWVGRAHPEDSVAKEWCLGERNPFTNIAPKGKQAREAFFMPQKQVAHAFMWKTPTHLNINGQVCLLIPSKLLLNKTDKFQIGWFSNFTVNKIIQLSDLKNFLFESAFCPAVIVKFSPKKPTSESYTMNYDVPKVDGSDPRKGVVSISAEDRKKISLSELIEHAEKNIAPILWKKNFWGTSRDIQLLDRLLKLPSLEDIVGTPKKPKRWIRGQGFKPFYQEKYDKDSQKYGEPKLAWWTKDHLYVEATNEGINLILTKNDCKKIGNRFKKLHRSPNRAIFKAPMVITNQGFSRMAYSNFPVLFQHSLQSITGHQKDKDLLMFLAAVLRSKLATYFLFHTAANWGTERGKVHLFELMRLPFSLPESTQDPKKSYAIISKVANHVNMLITLAEKNYLRVETSIKETEAAIEPLIFEYYQIYEREQMLIEDTVKIIEPSITPSSMTSKIPSLKNTNFDERKRYVKLLCKVLNSWAKKSKNRVSGEATISAALGLGVITILKSEATLPYRESTSANQMESILERIRKTLQDERGHFSYLKGLKIFEDDKLHIIKPLSLIHWSQTSALNDADELAMAILSNLRTT